MQKKLLIVGNSTLALALALEAEKTLAQLAHLEVTYLSSDERFVYYPNLTSLLGKKDFPDKKSLFQHVKMAVDTIKSVNLKDNVVIGESKTYDFDYLFLDQTATYTPAQIKIIATQANQLLLKVNAARKLGKKVSSRIFFSGPNVFSWQLALALQNDLESLSIVPQRLISLGCEVGAKQTTVSRYLEKNGIVSKRSESITPGFSVAAPLPIIAPTKIRGLLLDYRQKAVLTLGQTVENHPEVFIVDSKERSFQSLWRPDLTLARQFIRSIHRVAEGQKPEAIVLPKVSTLLTGPAGSFLWFANLISERWRCHLIKSADRAAVKKLFN